MKKKLVVLSGAGISKESGIATFRDSDGSGLWAGYNILDVCTPSAWAKDPTKVNDFYNSRRIEVLNASPNKAHISLAEAEKFFDIQIITQNVDDLHERAGSTKVLHLHGNILQAKSSDPFAGVLPDGSTYEVPKYPVGREGITMNDTAQDGYPLRPHIVFFGEDVPLIADAVKLVQEADAVIVVGTSLQVYPAANLIWHANGAPVWLIDPHASDELLMQYPVKIVKKQATIGIPLVLEQIVLTLREKFCELSTDF